MVHGPRVVHKNTGNINIKKGKDAQLPKHASCSFDRSIRRIPAIQLARVSHTQPAYSGARPAKAEFNLERGANNNTRGHDLSNYSGKYLSRALDLTRDITPTVINRADVNPNPNSHSTSENIRVHLILRYPASAHQCQS